MKIHLIATATVTALMLGGGAIAATAAPAEDAPPTASAQCQFGEELLHAWLWLPADLRGDLKSLRHLEPGEERHDAARDIRDRALDGEYGDAVQDRAERVRDRRLAAIATMPEELKSDLIELRDAAPADRRELAQEIADGALAGEYGEKVQHIAVEVQERVCD